MSGFLRAAFITWNNPPSPGTCGNTSPPPAVPSTQHDAVLTSWPGPPVGRGHFVAPSYSDAQEQSRIIASSTPPRLPRRRCVAAIGDSIEAGSPARVIVRLAVCFPRTPERKGSRFFAPFTCGARRTFPPLTALLQNERDESKRSRYTDAVCRKLVGSAATKNEHFIPTDSVALLKLCTPAALCIHKLPSWSHS